MSLCYFSSTILSTIKEGKIVPSEITIKLLQKEMETCDSSKFLIDGFPRCEENRIAFEQIVSFFLCFLPHGTVLFLTCLNIVEIFVFEFKGLNLSCSEN